MTLRTSALLLLASAGPLASAQTILFSDPFLGSTGAANNSLNQSFDTRQSGTLVPAGKGVPYEELTGTGPVGNAATGARRTTFNLTGYSPGLTFQATNSPAAPPSFYTQGDTPTNNANAQTFNGTSFGNNWINRGGGDVSFAWASPEYNFNHATITDGFAIDFTVDPGQSSSGTANPNDFASLVFGSANQGRYGGTAAGNVPVGETAQNSGGFGLAFYTDGRFEAFDGSTSVASGTGLATTGLVPITITVTQPTFGSGTATIVGTSGATQLFTYTRSAFADNYITLGGFAAGPNSDLASGASLAGHVKHTFGSLQVSQIAAPVPEPATMAALGLGAAALLRRRRKAA